MSADIVLWLAQDGITNGVIYALLALALLLVFSVTRVIFVPQGEYLSYAALSLALLQAGQLPGVVYVLVGGGLVAAAIIFTYELWLIRHRQPAACFQAFNNNHYVGLVIFVGLALDYLYR